MDALVLCDRLNMPKPLVGTEMVVVAAAAAADAAALDRFL